MPENCAFLNCDESIGSNISYKTQQDASLGVNSGYLGLCM